MPVEPPGEGGPGPAPKGSAKPCQECGKPANPATLPFCSPRCRDVDLNRWLSGSYVIPGRDDDDDEDAE